MLLQVIYSGSRNLISQGEKIKRGRRFFRRRNGDSPCGLRRDHGGTEIHTTAPRKDHAGSGGYALKELLPLEIPRWSSGNV